MRKHFIFLLSFLRIMGFTQDFYFERITNDNGLSQNNVVGICQDSDGYMWFGTYDGLNRFDGYDFKVYRTSNDENSIPSNLVHSIVEDQNKNLWISTFEDGVCKFNKTKEKFTRYKNTTENPDVLAGNSTQSIMCDSKNNIWVSTTQGISIISQNSDSVISITNMKNNPDDPHSLYDNSVYKVFEDSKGSIWVSTYSSLELMIFSDQKKFQNKFHHFLTDEKYFFISDIDELPEGIVTLNFNGALILQLDSINPESSKIIEFKNFASHELIVNKKNGSFWVGSFDGLYLFEPNPTGDIPYKISKHITEGEGFGFLSNQFIRSIYYDNNNILWLGTNGGGVLKYNAERIKIRHYKKTSNKGSISHNKTWCFLEDQEHNLLVGTEGGGINILPANQRNNYTSGFSSYDVSPPDEQNFVFDIIDISTEKNKEFLLGSGYKTLVSKLTKFDDSWATKPVLPEMEHQVMTLCRDNNGTVWLGSYLGGLGKLYTKNNRDILVIYKTDNSDIPTNIIRSFFEDSKGRLWVGTNKGLMVLSPEQKVQDSLNFTLFETDATDSTSISHNYTVPIIETSEGEIWIGTFGGGINIYQEGTTLTNGTFTSITVDDGLVNNTIKCMVEDNLGNIWVTSNKGLTRIDQTRKNIRSFTKTNGLQDMEFIDLSGFKRHNGELLFGGVNGFNAFFPEEIKRDTLLPVVVFNDIEIMNHPLSVNESIDGNIILTKTLNETDEIVLKHTQNSFRIFFSAIQYTEPQGNRYKYMLKNFDRGWISATVKSRFATYTNLEMGKYTFMLQASNSDGIWTETPKTLDIWIKPPFWLTTWFKVMSAIMLIVIISSIIWYRFRSIQARNLHLEAEIKKHTEKLIINNELLNETNTQLEERQQKIEEQSEELRTQKESLEETNATKDKFYSILAHDLKGPFNTILCSLDLLQMKIEKYDKKQIKEKVTIIEDAAKALLRLVENLLQWSRTQRGLMPFEPREIDVNSEVIDVIDVLRPSANSKGIQLNYSISDNRLTATLDANMFNTILRNLISNSIKYTKKDDTINVTVTRTIDTLLIKVSDSGLGISENVVPTLFNVGHKHTTEGTNNEKGTGLGLVLCKEFIEIHGGTINIDSIVNEGTTITFTLPLKQS